MTALTFATALEQFNAEFAPVRIPPIADFSPAIYWTLIAHELHPDDFLPALAKFAEAGLCEWLENISEPRLLHYTGLTNETCNRLGILQDEHFEPLSAHLYATDEEFRNEFAHDNLKYIVADMEEDRVAEMERDRANQQEDYE